MKKVVFVSWMILMIMVFAASFATADTIDHEFIEEYMYNKAGEIHCTSLGIVDISTMTQDAFNEWCFSLFPDMTQEQAIKNVYVGLMEEDLRGYEVWGLYICNEKYEYEQKFIVAFESE